MKDIIYFGYGANRSADMMKAIIGRKPEGVPAMLIDYELCIQRWGEIPDKVKMILAKCGWEMHELWYTPARVQLRDDKSLAAQTEIIGDHAIKQVVTRENYRTFLNPKAQMLEVANNVRTAKMRRLN